MISDIESERGGTYTLRKESIFEKPMNIFMMQKQKGKALTRHSSHYCSE